MVDFPRILTLAAPAAALSIWLVGGCQTVGEPEVEPAVVTAPSTATVTRPGVVLVDVEARRQALAASAKRGAFCTIAPPGGLVPDPPDGVKGPNGYGLDDRYNASADFAFRTGERCLGGIEDDCEAIVKLMKKWAERDAAIVTGGGSSPRYYNDTLTVNLRVVRPFVTAYAIARASAAVDSALDDAIRAWVRRVVTHGSHLMRNETSDHPWAFGMVKGAQNHGLASAAAWMAYGAMWGDDAAFRHGIDHWFLTLGTMRKDGSLPFETARGARAIFYDGRTVTALVAIAEMAARQGIDLYAQAPEPGRTIHHAVGFLLEALEDPAKVYPYARANYAPGPSNDWRTQDFGQADSTFGWAIPYTVRFPDHPNTRRLLAEDAPGKISVARSLATTTLMRSEWAGADFGCLFQRTD